MAYHTGAYRLISDWITNECPIIYQNQYGFEVRNVQSRYFLIKSGYKIAEMIDTDILEKKYGGNFDRWIQSIWKKDIKKIQTLAGYIDQINADIEQIQLIWSIDN